MSLASRDAKPCIERTDGACWKVRHEQLTVCPGGFSYVRRKCALCVLCEMDGEAFWEQSKGIKIRKVIRFNQPNKGKS